MSWDWPKRVDSAELERQAERLEVLTAWAKAGIDVNSLYSPSEARKGTSRGNPDPGKG